MEKESLLKLFENPHLLDVVNTDVLCDGLKLEDLWEIRDKIDIEFFKHGIMMNQNFNIAENEIAVCDFINHFGAENFGDVSSNFWINVANNFTPLLIGEFAHFLDWDFLTKQFSRQWTPTFINQFKSRIKNDITISNETLEEFVECFEESTTTTPNLHDVDSDHLIEFIKANYSANDIWDEEDLMNQMDLAAGLDRTESMLCEIEDSVRKIRTELEFV